MQTFKLFYGIVIAFLITPALSFPCNTLLVICNFPTYRRPTHERPGNLSNKTKPPRHHLIQTLQCFGVESTEPLYRWIQPIYRLPVDAEEETGGRVFGVSVRIVCVLRCQ